MINNKLILATIILFSTCYSFSQNGVTASIDFSILTSNDFKEIQDGIGGTIGLSRIYPIYKSGDFIPEFSVSYQNFKLIDRATHLHLEQFLVPYKSSVDAQQI